MSGPLKLDDYAKLPVGDGKGNYSAEDIKTAVWIEYFLQGAVGNHTGFSRK